MIGSSIRLHVYPLANRWLGVELNILKSFPFFGLFIIFTFIIFTEISTTYLVTDALAEEAVIPLTSSEEIESAVGYVISENRLASEIPAQVKVLPDGRSTISFEIGGVERSSVYVSARVKTKSGKSFFTDITDVKSADLVMQPLPACVRSSKIPFVQRQLENLKSLTENRHTQRGLIKDKIRRELDSGEAKRILKIEKALGLTEQQPISADMHPIELIKREFSLLAALKRWEDSKVLKDAQLPPPNKTVE